MLFQGDTHALIPLYALGVFLSFTLSQASMVRYWFRHRGPPGRFAPLLNGTGAAATGVVAVIIGVTKFTHGAWIVVVLLPCMVALFVAIRRHYDDVALQLSVESAAPAARRPRGTRSSRLVGDVHRGMLPADRVRPGPLARRAGRLRRGGSRANAPLRGAVGQVRGGMPLVVLRSPTGR